MARFSSRCVCPIPAWFSSLLAFSILLASVFLVSPGLSVGQAPTVPDFNSGFTPYQGYNGGDIDSVNLNHRKFKFSRIMQ
jgi:hypothetical protein